MNKITVNFDMKVHIATYKNVGITEHGDIIHGIARLIKRIQEETDDVSNVEFHINVYND